MARMNVFNRNDNDPQPVARSLQDLSHRHTTTMRYGEIVPFFSAQMYPHESIKIDVTNLLRTIPMKTPQLSRVKIISRFMAVPNRIMWLAFEEYIDGIKDAQFKFEEPYIVNFNAVARRSCTSVPNGTYRVNTTVTSSYGATTVFNTKSAFVAAATSAGITDYSVLGFASSFSVTFSSSASSGAGTLVDAFSPGLSVNSYSRYIDVKDDTLEVPVDENSGYQFFPHELGDYFNEPLYVASIGSDVSGRISAFPYAAYQLCYSYMYRNANVQTRVDDLYEMQAKYDDQRMPEFSSYYRVRSVAYTSSPYASNFWSAPTATGGFSFDPPISSVAAGADGYAVNPPAISAVTDKSKSSDQDAVVKTSWANVEKFPLKGGPNLVMQALNWKENGTPDLVDSRISLTRLRYANWQSDRFTMSNPWQQRGEEALIPVTVAASASDEATKYQYLQWFYSPSNDTTFSDAVKISYKGFEGYPVGEGAKFGDVAPTTYPGIASNLTGAYNHLVTPRVDLGSYLEQVPMYVTPSNFRFAMQLQKLKEMSSRTDGRYKSFLAMVYGAKSQDDRLDRPEFIGGSVQELDITEVAQTSEGSETALGTLAGRGYSAKKSHSFSYHASEHTVVIGMIHIIPDTEYVGGLDRTHHTTDPFDWAYPQFAGLSEQPIRMSELSLAPTKFDELINSQNDEVFGYEPRYNELRVKHSFATGAFRDVMNTTGSREYYKPWLITRNFGLQYDVKTSGNTLVGVDFVKPTLSPEFLSMRHTVDNSNFEVTDEAFMYPFMLDSYFNVRWTRIIPSRGIPRI